MPDLNLLIVDDEPGMREGMRRSLRNYSIWVEDVEDTFNIRPETAGSGEEALEKIAACVPDLMLLDNKLPGIQGMDLLQHLVDGQIDISIIMVTAYASIEAAVSATKRGAFDFLAKPFTPKELQVTLDKSIRHLVLQRQARKLKEEKKRTRFDLISVVSHELKAPLSALESHLHLLKEPEVFNEAAYMQSVDRCFKRIADMRKLINDFLDLTRIESGQRQRQIESVDICEILQAGIDAIADSAGQRAIRISINAPDSLAIQTDRSEIEIILNNLLSNAVKYNKDGGTLAVELLDDGPSILIRVSDTGIGISEKDSALLFNEFLRIRNKKTRDITGSGLGLAIVRKIVMMHGGSIAVESKPDVGTTFSIKLPKQQKSIGSNDGTC